MNYAKFTEALRMGRIKYIHQPGRRLRIGPDLEKPFGTSAIKRSCLMGSWRTVRRTPKSTTRT